MKSHERARRVLDEIRDGAITDLSPQRSEAIIAAAIREAKAHGAGMVLFLFKRVAGANAGNDALVQKLTAIVEDMLRKDEEISSEA